MSTLFTSDLAVAWLPNAGLGNKLYLWARGWTFAKLNGISFQCYGWTKFKLGPLLRREKSSRLYLSDMRREPLVNAITFGYRWLTCKKNYDPLVETVASSKGGNLFIFRDLQANTIADDSFKPFTPHRDELRSALWAQMTDSCQARLADLQAPVVGIHVRRGDFRRLGNWLQPIEVFCQRLHNVRESAGVCLPATVFSDGTNEELEPLLKMPQVMLSPSNPDIVDIIQLSRSRVIITSRASTFSSWAAFLSDGVVLRDPEFYHKPCRPSAINSIWYEGMAVDDATTWPAQLKVNLKSIADEVNKQKAGCLLKPGSNLLCR